MADDYPGQALAVGAMVAECRWNPSAFTSETLLLDGNGTRLLQLPTLNLVSLTEVKIARRSGGFGDPLVIGPYDVSWSSNGVIELPDGNAWPPGRRNVSVTYSGGYETAPDDLAAALRSLGKRLAGSTHGATYRRMGDAGIGFGARVAEGALLVTEQMVFDRYRIPGVA